MLDFRLDDEQEMLVAAIGRFSAEKTRKVYRDAEEDGDISADVVNAGWEIGVLPSAIPEQFGGFGEHSAVTAAIATEEFAWGDLATTLKIMAPNQVAIPIMLCGTDAQKAAYLPRFLDETPPKVAAALTEPTYQFDPRDLQTTVTADGDSYRLNGKKIFVIGAADAETLLVYAQQDGTTQAFLVAANAEGVTLGERDKLMGLQALDTFSIHFENVLISAENKVGGDAGIDFSLILNHSRVALGAAAVGVARAGLEYAVEYAKGREQFGRKIAQNQSIAFMLAGV